MSRFTPLGIERHRDMYRKGKQTDEQIYSPWDRET